MNKRAARIPVDKPLTRRQRLFVAALPTAANATEAAVKAGYSPLSATPTASEIQRRPNVAAALEKSHAVIAKEQKITEAEVAGYLRREIKAGDKKVPNAVRVDAVQVLAKLGGLITDKVKIDTPAPQVNVYLREFSLAELLELRDAARKRIEAPRREDGKAKEVRE